jgi:hypothetical protein
MDPDLIFTNFHVLLIGKIIIIKFFLSKTNLLTSNLIFLYS